MRAVPITLDHVVINVSDRARSDDFYARVLGVEVIRPVENFRYYRLGGQQLNVHGPDMEIEPRLLARLPVRPGNSDICFEWHGAVEDAMAHLRTCGVEIETGPIATAGARGPGISIYFRDPDGSLLEFITYPENIGNEEAAK